MVSADTNLFIYAADPDSPYHERAREFFSSQMSVDSGFVLCELVVVELYMQLRNRAVFKNPYTALEAVEYCRSLKTCPYWRCVDYQHGVSHKLWRWAEMEEHAHRRIIDARIGYTLIHHGVRRFATANVKDFRGLGFSKVWNPLAQEE